MLHWIGYNIAGTRIFRKGLHEKSRLIFRGKPAVGVEPTRGPYSPAGLDLIPRPAMLRKARPIPQV